MPLSSYCLQYKNIIVILGNGNITELDERVSLAAELYKKNLNSILFFTGTPQEIKNMQLLATKKLSNPLLAYEDKSKNTIDNIYNTFSLIQFPPYINNRPPVILCTEYDGVALYDEVPDYTFFIVSSDYHMERFEYICKNLNISNKRNINFYGSLTKDKKQLQRRLYTENYIKSNQEQYLKMIHNYN